MEEKKSKIKILFLYTELAGYTMACLEALAKHQVDIHLVRWPVNKEAPFEFSFSGCEVYDRESFNNEDLIKFSEDLNPDIIYCSGWIDKGYLGVCKRMKKAAKPVIVGFDNQWNGSVKQYIAGLLSPFYIRKHFNYAWIPGDPQYKFARFLGFKDEHVLRGVYSADTARFDTYFENAIKSKKAKVPHRFLYVGRYVDWKGIDELWNAFQQLDNRKDWELWCVGTGELYDSRPEIEGIKHLGFIQPDELQQVIDQTTVFVLPSRFEPWGVVLHEYAAAGFPILSTKDVGAATAFLEHGENGWFFEKENVDSLKDVMQKVINTADSKLLEMGETSRKLAGNITPSIWAETLLSVL